MQVSAKERQVLGDLKEALGSSLNLHEVMELAYPLLLRVVAADHATLGVTRRGQPADFEWIVAHLPATFFAGYAEMSPHDFVRRAVVGTPNVVLRDSEMVTRGQLETNMMYRRARELGVPLEQVMSVMLQVGEEWSSGVALYRARRRPFSERDRRVLQQLTPAFANAVRNCRRFEEVAGRGSLLEKLFALEKRALIAIEPPAREVTRTGSATALVEKWFPGAARSPGGLPDLLIDKVRDPAAQARDAVPAAFTRASAAETLVIRLYSVSDFGKTYVVLALDEVPHVPAVPMAWQGLLTRREWEVTAKVLQGWSNQLIADDIQCAEATVKKHLQNVFDKLGLSSRMQLLARANRER